MSTYRKIIREVLRRKVGNKALSKVYRRLKAKPIKRKKRGLMRWVKKSRFLGNVITYFLQILKSLRWKSKTGKC